MPTTEPERVRVAVGILRRGECFLVQQRNEGQVCAGQWEFPGGKVEAGESPSRALHRELFEELGVTTQRARQLLSLPFDYPHARVQLEVFVVGAFVGDAHGREGQATRWRTAGEIRKLNVLAAVHPILDALAASGK